MKLKTNSKGEAILFQATDHGVEIIAFPIDQFDADEFALQCSDEPTFMTMEEALVFCVKSLSSRVTELEKRLGEK